MTLTIPDTLPWAYATYDHVGAITEEDGTSVLDVSVTMNTTAASGFHDHMRYLVRAANLMPQLAAIAQVVAFGIYRANHKGYVVCACCGEQSENPHAADCIVRLAGQLHMSGQLPASAPDAQLVADLEAARAAVERQNLLAAKVADRLQDQPDQLQRTLRAARHLTTTTERTT